MKPPNATPPSSDLPHDATAEAPPLPRSQPLPEPRPNITPRFGRLLAVCLAAVAFCGVLVWFASTYLTQCC